MERGEKKCLFNKQKDESQVLNEFLKSWDHV
jgi:hypothetical protein